MPFRNVIIEVPTQKRHPYGQLTGIEEKPHITIQSTVSLSVIVGSALQTLLTVTQLLMALFLSLALFYGKFVLVKLGIEQEIPTALPGWNRRGRPADIPGSRAAFAAYPRQARWSSDPWQSRI